MKTLTKAEDLKRFIRDIPDFPKKGIIFKDITTLLGDAQAFQMAIDAFMEKLKDKKVDAVVSVESRGFIFGSVLAYNLGASFVPVRKKGKLPYKTKGITYELEYGTDSLEIHEDALTSKSRVLIVDDLLATGGTVSAVARLVKSFGSEIVAIAFLVDLTFLNGRSKLKGIPIISLIDY